MWAPRSPERCRRLTGRLWAGGVDGFVDASTIWHERACLRPRRSACSTISSKRSRATTGDTIGQVVGPGRRRDRVGDEQVVGILRDPVPFFAVLTAIAYALPIVTARVNLAVLRIGAQIIIGIVQGLYQQLPALWDGLRAVGASPRRLREPVRLAHGTGRSARRGIARRRGSGAADLLDWLGLLTLILPYMETAATWPGRGRRRSHHRPDRRRRGALAGKCPRTFLGDLLASLPGYLNNAFKLALQHRLEQNLMSGLASGIYAGFTAFVQGALEW